MEEREPQIQEKEICIWKIEADEAKRGEGTTFSLNDKGLLCYKCDGIRCLYNPSRYTPQVQ